MELVATSPPLNRELFSFTRAAKEHSLKSKEISSYCKNASWSAFRVQRNCLNNRRPQIEYCNNKQYDNLEIISLVENFFPSIRKKKFQMSSEVIFSEHSKKRAFKHWKHASNFLECAILLYHVFPASLHYVSSLKQYYGFSML